MGLTDLRQDDVLADGRWTELCEITSVEVSRGYVTFTGELSWEDGTSEFETEMVSLSHIWALKLWDCPDEEVDEVFRNIAAKSHAVAADILVHWTQTNDPERRRAKDRRGLIQAPSIAPLLSPGNPTVRSAAVQALAARDLVSCAEVDVDRVFREVAVNDARAAINLFNDWPVGAGDRRDLVRSDSLLPLLRSEDSKIRADAIEIVGEGAWGQIPEDRKEAKPNRHVR